MKDVMHFHVRGQLKLVSLFTQFFEYFVRANVPGHELFGVRPLEGEVFAAKQNFLPLLKSACLVALIVVRCLPITCRTHALFCTQADEAYALSKDVIGWKIAGPMQAHWVWRVVAFIEEKWRILDG
jgi:hypothetical protein